MPCGMVDHFLEPARMAGKLTTEEKQTRKAGELIRFVQEYARKARPGLDPNDRSYDRGIEARIKRMRPEELDRLLREDEA